jgi:manganese efflux pump family protein
MHSITIIGIAFALGMDAFAASVSHGCSCDEIRPSTVLPVAFSFGLFQAVMPLLGWLVGTRFALFVRAWDHWAAFGLLGIVGGKMLIEGVGSLRGGACEDPADDYAMTFRRLMVLSLATSIDALAVGVTFAFLEMNPIVPAATIGGITFLVSGIGVCAGGALRHLLSEWAEIVGGVVLVGLGLKILIEHLTGGP